MEIDFLPGKVVFDDLDFDPNRPLEEQRMRLKEDLLQVVFPRAFVLDVGWYPEDFVLPGTFKIIAVRDENWDQPFLEQTCADLPTLVVALKGVVEKIRAALASEP